MFFVFYFVGTIYLIYLVLSIKSSLLFWGKSYLDILYDLLDMVLDLIC